MAGEWLHCVVKGQSTSRHPQQDYVLGTFQLVARIDSQWFGQGPRSKYIVIRWNVGVGPADLHAHGFILGDTWRT
jgi:hypothetical protein